MDRISGPNNVVVGGLRQWQDRNNSTNTLGTFGNALWFNGVQETLLKLVEALGMVATDADNTQVYQAIRALAGSTETQITTAGTTSLARLQAGLVEVNATAGNIVIDLPAPTADGVVFRYEFLRVDASANTVTVLTPSGHIFNEPAEATSILLPPDSLTRLICDSSNYIQDGPYVGPSALAAYALLNGSSGQNFNVANATALTHAVPLAQVLAPTRIAQYGNNGTFTVPAGVTELLVSGCAGGAGGNGSFSGGAGQSVIKTAIAVTPGHTLGIGIGAGGAGGNPNATGGGNTVLVDNNTSTTLLALVGATGPSGTTVESTGYPNGSGYSSGSTNSGASGPFGGGGGAAGTNAGTIGQNASGYGAGGGQGQTAAGGNGAPGYLALEF